MDFGIKGKKAGVNSYRFIAMYIIIGLVVGALTVFAQQNTTRDYYESNPDGRIVEITESTQNIYSNSTTLVQASQFQLTPTFGDQPALGQSWVSIFSKSAFLPTGLIPKEQKASASQLEQSLNQLVIWFRWIIMLFALYEVFQMIIRKVT